MKKYKIIYTNGEESQEQELLKLINESNITDGLGGCQYFRNGEEISFRDFTLDLCNEMKKKDIIASSEDSAQLASSGNFAKVVSSGGYAKVVSSDDYVQVASSGNFAKVVSSGDYAQVVSSGYSAQVASSGGYAQLVSSGDFAKVASSGDYAKVVSSDDYAQVASSGYCEKVVSSGDYAQVASSGDYAQLVSSGNFAQVASSGGYAKVASSGNSAKVVSSGIYAKVASSGNFAKVASSGDFAKVASSGNSAQLASSGNFAKVASSGDFAKVASSGDFAQHDIRGKESVCFDCSIGGVIKGTKGTHIALCEWYYDNNKWHIRGTATAQIDGKILKENTYYGLYNGKITEIDITDGVKSVVIKNKGKIKKLKTIDTINNIITDKISYVVSDNNGNFAHGETIKKAKESLIYKISNRDSSMYKDYTLDTIVSFEEAIKLYRVITGACEFGTKHFIETNKIKNKKYTIKEIIEITKGQFGNEELTKFFTEKK